MGRTADRVHYERDKPIVIVLVLLTDSGAAVSARVKLMFRLYTTTPGLVEELLALLGPSLEHSASNFYTTPD